MEIRLRTEKGDLVVLDSEDDFLAEGGQAKLYLEDTPTNKKVHKIYHDAGHVIAEQKLRELATMSNHPQIIAPEQFDLANGKRVGYVMKFAENAKPLAATISNGFWKNNNIDVIKATETAMNFIKLVRDIHKFSAISAIGDPNEFNWLIDLKTLEIVLAVDTDAYGTASFPVSAVAPGVRDPLTDKFNEDTDWYGVGIVLFMWFVGVHPFMGMHPDYGINDTVLRMKNGASNFSSKATLPVNARPIDSIPGALKAWMKDMFENKARSAPPTSMSPSIVIAQPVREIAVDASKLTVKKLSVENDEITEVKFVRGYRHTRLKNEPQFVVLGNGAKFEVKWLNGYLKLPSGDILCDGYTIVDNTIFAFNGKAICQIGLNQKRASISSFVENSWGAMKNTTVHDGVFLSNILGNPYFQIPWPDAMYEVRVNELKGNKISNVVRRGRAIYVVGLDIKSGKNVLHIFLFNRQFTSYKYNQVSDTASTDINMIFMDSGVVILLDEFNNLHIKHADMNVTKTVSNVGLPQGATLTTDGQTAMFFASKTIYSMSLVN